MSTIFDSNHVHIQLDIERNMPYTRYNRLKLSANVYFALNISIENGQHLQLLRFVVCHAIFAIFDIFAITTAETTTTKIDAKKARII